MFIRKKQLIALSCLFLLSAPAFGQFWDSATGLLQCPSADMNKDGTFMITNNFMNKHSLPEAPWGYNTFEYGFHVDLWSRLEFGYVCVIFDGKRKQSPGDIDMIMFNQDRHFNAKLLLLRESEFGIKWIPALAIGVSDPTTGSGGDYSKQGVDGGGNGYFNRYYAVMTKHFQTRVGAVGAHLGYLYNVRTDIPMNGPCAAIDWVPVWLNNRNYTLKAIAEYDSRTFNIGFIASFWDDRFEAMFELMAMKWVNFGVRYKLALKK